MTKAELIKFLEPFTDDIKIFYEDYEYGFLEIEPQYKITKSESNETYKPDQVDFNEGYIIL